MKNIKNLNDEAILFESSSSTAKVRFIIYLILYALLIAYLLSHFKENPVFISVASAFVLLIAFLNVQERIIVYQTKVLVVYQTVLPFVFKKHEFRFKDISSIEAQLPLTESKQFWLDLMPVVLAPVSIWNTIVVTYKNGKTKELKSKTSRDEFLKAFDVIEAYSSINITKTF